MTYEGPFIDDVARREYEGRAILHPRDARGPGLLLGLAAKKQHGKDTMADHLVAAHGFARLSFAGPMKESAAAALGTTVEQLEAMKEDPNCRIQMGMVFHDLGMPHPVVDISVRQYLQYVGTEAHRKIPEFGEDVWIDMLAPKVDPEGRYVATDARFANEQQQIKALGGYVIQINRPGMPTGDGHASEQIDHGLADFIIDNDSSIEEFGSRIDLVIDIIRRDREGPSSR